MLVIKRTKRFREMISNRTLTFSNVSDLYLMSVFILPTYFGIRLGFFDMTATRALLVLLLYGIWKNTERRKIFVEMCYPNKDNIFLYLFWLIMLYTNILRMSINGVFLTCIDVFLSTIAIWYLISYEYGIEETLSRIRVYAWFLGLCGIVEGVMGTSPFSLLNTLNKGGITSERFGSVRICGPCTTSNGYGLYLLILIPLVCINYKKNKIDILKNKWLVLLLMINVFFTGTRLAIGVAILELFLLIVFSDPQKLPRLISGLCILTIICVFFIKIFPNSSITQSFLRMILQVVDFIIGTNYAEAYGVDTLSLYNSNYYRTLLLNIFSLDYLNPWLGRGTTYHFSYVIEGYWIQSIDNYYVGLYVLWGYPGLVAFLVMSLRMVFKAVGGIFRYKNRLCLVILIILISYYIGLWYLDQLQTYKYIYILFGLILNETRGHFIENVRSQDYDKKHHKID